MNSDCLRIGACQSTVSGAGTHAPITASPPLHKQTRPTPRFLSRTRSRLNQSVVTSIPRQWNSINSPSDDDPWCPPSTFHAAPPSCRCGATTPAQTPPRLPAHRRQQPTSDETGPLRTPRPPFPVSSEDRTPASPPGAAAASRQPAIHGDLRRWRPFAGS